MRLLKPFPVPCLGSALHSSIWGLCLLAFAVSGACRLTDLRLCGFKDLCFFCGGVAVLVGF